MINYYTNSQGFTDNNDYIDIVYKNSILLHEKKSKYQNIKVYKNELYGKILVIDDDLQLTDFDEHNYHEMIAHVPINYNSEIEKVLIIGGGDGGTAREVLKHKNIKHVDQVEIDKEVVEICKKFFPELSIAYEDSRLNLIIDDGAKWVQNMLEKNDTFYDLIIVDSTDYNTALRLFTAEFYEDLKNLLSKYGILIFNNMSVQWEADVFKMTKKNLSSIFKHAHPYQVYQPSYASGHYSFMFCSEKIDPLNYAIDWEAWKKKDLTCRYYNKDIHISSFHLPNLAKEDCDKKLYRLGTHFLVDGDGCSFDKLNNLDHLIKMCFFIAGLYKLNVEDYMVKKFTPQGISVIFLLSESHLSIHTWPELGKFSLDLFSCSCFKFDIRIKKNKINLKTVINSYLRPTSINLNSIEREI